MTTMRLAGLANVVPSEAARRCYRCLDAQAPDDYRQLAALLVDDWCRRRVASVGIGGGQGAGKSTLGRLITEAGTVFGIRIEVLSLDDFYLTQEERIRLGETIHPLLATRGPPGTHAVAQLRDVMAALRQPGVVEVPRFDKGTDTRSGFARIRGGVDLVVLDGWCVGAPIAEASIDEPINALEREHDAHALWRSYIESALGGPYAKLNDDLEELVFLKVPGLDAVRRWRLQQEGERPPGQRLSAAEVNRFVEHYERITRRMLATMPAIADVVVDLDDAHRVSAMRLRATPSRP
ncbi:MAG: kinase [Gammaproteobacteria bacterium]|nr:kinase [Gammaproteobacteria bacterium]